MSNAATATSPERSRPKKRRASVSRARPAQTNFEAKSRWGLVARRALQPQNHFIKAYLGAYTAEDYESDIRAGVVDAPAVNILNHQCPHPSLTFEQCTCATPRPGHRPMPSYYLREIRRRRSYTTVAEFVHSTETRLVCEDTFQDLWERQCTVWAELHDAQETQERQRHYVERVVADVAACRAQEHLSRVRSIMSALNVPEREVPLWLAQIGETQSLDMLRRLGTLEPPNTLTGLALIAWLKRAKVIEGRLAPA